MSAGRFDSAVVGDNRTIVAIATARGRGALSVVRMSGPDAQQIGAAVLAPFHWTPGRAFLAELHAPDGGAAIDRVIAASFPAPRSFTGEDMLELTTHGGLLVPALARYQAEIRPMLIEAVPRGQTARPARPPGAFLWMAQGGTPLTTGALRKAIARHTLLRFGHAMNPHLFRDCVATTASNEDPNHMQQAAQLLGHTKLRTTERSYIAANSTAALGDFSRMIAAMRKTNRCRIGRSAHSGRRSGVDAGCQARTWITDRPGGSRTGR